MSDAESMSAEVKDRVFNAVRAELRGSGLDNFSIAGVARRAGIDPDVIRAQWHDRRVLLMEVMLDRTSALAWNPDTGSLYTDLEAVTALAASLSQSPTERETFRRVLPGAGEADLGEVVSDLWAARFSDGAALLRRAADRGQLRDGIVPDEAIRMFAAAFYYDVIFTDSPVRPEYAEQVIDIFMHGVVGAAGRDRPWPYADSQIGAESGSVLADQAVEAARRAVALMRVWADALPDAVVLYEAVRDTDGQVVDFVCRDLNRATCEEIGLPRSDLLGRRLLETLPMFASTGLLKYYANCADGRGPLVLNDFEYQHFDQARYLDIRAASAGPDLITVTWRDSTDRVESARRDARYRFLMDDSAIPAGLAAPEGNFVFVNRAMATMIGYDVDTMLTMTWQDLTAPEDLEAELAGIADLLAGRTETFRTIKQILHADGHWIWGDLAVSCVRRPDGEVENLIAQIVDVTEFIDALGEDRARQLLAERRQRNQPGG